MSKSLLSRSLIAGLALSILAPTFAEAQTYRMFDPSSRKMVTIDTSKTGRAGRTVAQEFHRTVVAFASTEAPGTIIIDSASRHLYFVLSGDMAIRFGVGAGRDGFRWSGTVRVGRKAEWPTWTPPKAMIRRQPELVKYAGGMPGGPDNPLGARALYLYDGDRDTMYRIHGTNEPWSIGQFVSSGCLRMMNQDITELHSLVKTGAKVIVY
ncbi:MAG TPA: L,D-transpeptidase [Afifellaceae bacterium]|nr:L,D-transpeptidase [Afifellaceae bacterium]